MVFDKYNRKFSKDDLSSGLEKKESTAPKSSYLSRLAGQVGSTDSQSTYRREASTPSGNSQLWAGTPGHSDKNVRANIEKRLHWVETAFKKGEETQADGARSAISSIRNRINALLTYELPPRVRSELETIDGELSRLL